MVAVAMVVMPVVLLWHGAQRDPAPLLLLPLEVAVVELEVLVLDGLGEREFLGMPNF